MQIRFNSSYLSISSFPTVDIPDFCLVTGLNGAGKSHFLQALKAGNLRADCAPGQTPNDQTEIRLFDWNSLVPNDTGTYRSETLRNERVEAFDRYNEIRSGANLTSSLQNIVRQYQFLETYLQDPVSALRLSIDDVALLCGEHDALRVHEQLKLAADQPYAYLLNRIDEPIRSRIRLVAAAAGKPFMGLTQDDFFQSNVSSWGEVNIFQQSFARLFVAYRDAYLANQIGQFLASKGEVGLKYVSDNEFLRENGPPPWDLANNSFAAADLDFAINKPALNDNSPFQPELTKQSTGANIPFSALSSGEKVLMSLASCVYYSNDRRQLALLPKVILLDEVDAPLHPSMSKNLINTIQQTLVASYGIKTILTTHSPSTVAMAPEEAVYVMRTGAPGLHKCSRADALNILTVGVPTLAISYEGRRQVFVESPADAKIFDAIYKLVKPRISSERSLEFVATGTRSPTGVERNTGCDVVRKIVADLSAAGNQSVFGLIDWDGHHSSTQRITVLAEGKRNGLENLVFDPLGIALLICREFPDQKQIIGVPRETNFVSFSQWDPAMMQVVVTRICEQVLKSAAKETVSVEYLDGMTLEVDARYLTTDDHALEALLVAAFPFLQEVSKQQAGRLMQRMIATVLTDVPNAIPIELLNVMRDILERPSH